MRYGDLRMLNSCKVPIIRITAITDPRTRRLKGFPYCGRIDTNNVMTMARMMLHVSTMTSIGMYAFDFIVKIGSVIRVFR